MSNKNENFSLNKIKHLSPIDAKEYITKYFVPLSNGNHAMLIDGIYTIKDDQEIKRSYFNRMQKELCNYYFKEFSEVKTVVYEVNKETFFDDKINLCPAMKFKYNPEYIPNENVKNNLDFLLNYIKEILCSDRVDCYEFLLKWISNMLKGNKNNSCLYLKGIQGVGKSSLFVFLSNHVLGTPLCLETGSDPIRTKFNEILGGKLLVCIEELENFSRAEWESISSTLKRQITSKNITLQNKCTKAYESNNINNYILCSNNDSVKDDDGRRYFILDIATHRVGDRAFYDKLYMECFTDEVGEAFFNYVYSINTERFNPQAFPLTQNKIDSITKRLDNVYKFIKDFYILKNIPINCSAQDLYEEFKYSGSFKMTKEDFHRKMSEAGFNRTKNNNKLWYNITHETLLECAKNKMWLHELDEYETTLLKQTKKTMKTLFVDDSESETEIEDFTANKKKYNNSYIKKPLK